MPRVRNLAPGFFANEDLAELGPYARLLFAGLWCWADREGRLEDRPKRLKAAIFPYDDLDIEAVLNDLAAAGFIQRYAANGGRYIAVVNFLKYQHPHPREQPSMYPGTDEAEPFLYMARPGSDPGASEAPPRHVQGNALALSSPAGSSGSSGSSYPQDLQDLHANSHSAEPGRARVQAAPPTDEERVLLADLRRLPRWPPKRTAAADLEKLRMWRKIYHERPTRADLCDMDSWLQSNPHREPNPAFVQNWIKKPELNGASHDHVQTPRNQPAGNGDAFPSRAELAARSAERHPIISTVLSDL